MKLETHIESFKEHKETIFDWAVKVKGLKVTYQDGRNQEMQPRYFKEFKNLLRKYVKAYK